MSFIMDRNMSQKASRSQVAFSSDGLSNLANTFSSDSDYHGKYDVSRLPGVRAASSGFRTDEIMHDRLSSLRVDRSMGN